MFSLPASMSIFAVKEPKTLNTAHFLIEKVVLTFCHATPILKMVLNFDILDKFYDKNLVKFLVVVGGCKSDIA